MSGDEGLARGSAVGHGEVALLQTPAASDLGTCRFYVAPWEISLPLAHPPKDHSPRWSCSPLASCRLEMNDGRQLSAPLALSSPSPCPPGTPQILVTQKINPPASLITVARQEPCSRSASQTPVINSLQFAAASLGRSWVATVAGTKTMGTPVLGDPVTRACRHRRVPAGLPSLGWLRAGSLGSPCPLVSLCVPLCCRPKPRVSSLPPLPACGPAWPGALCSLPIAAS